MSDLCANKVRVKHTRHASKRSKGDGFGKQKQDNRFKNIKKVGMHTSVR